MNKSMIIGLVGGIGIATAGGVAGYALMSQTGSADASGSAIVEEAANVEAGAIVEASPAPANTQQAAAPTPTRAAAPVPQRAAAPRSTPAPTATQAAAPAPAPVVEQRCWDEEVVVQADPKDDRAIAGTATGAILGGAIAKRLGDDNDLATAAGAAAGAFAGRRVQRNIQENNTTTVIERRCEPVE